MTARSSKQNTGKRMTVMDASQLRRAMQRIAHEIIEQTEGASDIALIGIKARGAPLAQRLADYISKSAECTIPVGMIDITLYRDDFRTRDEAPTVGPSEIPFDVDGRTLVLVDDVLYTGRPVRAALDNLMDYGRPKAIRLAVLVDRGQRELPIRADFVGQEFQIEDNQQILVRVKEVDGEDAVYLVDQ